MHTCWPPGSQEVRPLWHWKRSYQGQKKGCQGGPWHRRCTAAAPRALPLVQNSNIKCRSSNSTHRRVSKSHSLHHGLGVPAQPQAEPCTARPCPLGRGRGTPLAHLWCCSPLALPKGRDPVPGVDEGEGHTLGSYRGLGLC